MNIIKYLRFAAILFLIIRPAYAQVDDSSDFPEESFIYTPDEMLNFNIEDYLIVHAPHLVSYAEAISHTSGYTSISPKLLITIIESQTQLLTTNDDLSTIDKPFRNLSKKNGFSNQLKDVASQLSSLYYQNVESNTPRPGNSALSQLLKSKTANTHFKSAEVVDLKNLTTAYDRLFPHKTETNKKKFSANSTIPSVNFLQLPFPLGESWRNKGTHSHTGSGSIYSSLDFFDAGGGWGSTTSNSWVAASHGGTAVRHSSCFVEVIGSNGWSTTYYHLDNVQVVTNQTVQKNASLSNYANNLSQALCDGGQSSGPHVHFSLKKNGVYVSLDNVELSGYVVNAGRFNYDTNCNYFWLDDNGVKICAGQPVYNRGTNNLIPDLVVQSLIVNNNTVAPGQSFTLSGIVKNLGSGNASSSTILRYYRSTDSTITSNDSQVGTDAVVALNSQGTSAENISLVAPSTVGVYYYGACVQSVLAESNVGNNCSSGVQVTVSNATAPDLVAQSPSVSDNSLEPGQSFTVSVTARNQGTATSANTTMRYFISTDSTIDTSDVNFSIETVSPLSAGSMFSGNESHNAPTFETTYWVGACIVSVAGESNINNNCSVGVQVEVSSAPPLAPDLVVQSPSVNDATLVPGQPFTVSVTARNQGTITSSNTTMRYFISTDSTIDTGDAVFSSEVVPPLSAGSTFSGNENHNAPTLERTYWVGACIVPLSAESNTHNNCSAGVPIVVANASVLAPDLVVQSPSVSNNSLEPGQSFSLSATVRNQGLGTSASTIMRYYLSTDSTINSADVQFDTKVVSPLSAGSALIGTESHNAPTLERTYWVGTCIEAVMDESNTNNNCSIGVAIVVAKKVTLGDSFEPDNNSSTAKPILNSETQRHSFHVAGDVDWVTFTLNETVANIKIETSSAGFRGDTQLTLYNDRLSQVHFDDDGGNYAYSLIGFSSLQAGTYFIKVNEFSGGVFDGYDLTMSYDPEQQAADDDFFLYIPAIILTKKKRLARQNAMIEQGANDTVSPGEAVILPEN